MAPFFLGCTHGHLEPFYYEKLVRLCGMLTSDFPGERANAAQKASAFIKQAGLTWRDIIIPPPRADNQHQAGASASTAGDWVPDDWHDRAEEILASGRSTNGNAISAHISQANVMGISRISRRPFSTESIEQRVFRHRRRA